MDTLDVRKFQASEKIVRFLGQKNRVTENHAYFRCNNGLSLDEFIKLTYDMEDEKKLTRSEGKQIGTVYLNKA